MEDGKGEDDSKIVEGGLEGKGKQIVCETVE
jgi:hypothetical protein